MNVPESRLRFGEGVLFLQFKSDYPPFDRKDIMSDDRQNILAALKYLIKEAQRLKLTDIASKLKTVLQQDPSFNEDCSEEPEAIEKRKKGQSEEH